MLNPSNFHSIPKQAKRLEERHLDNIFDIEICGIKMVINAGVYQTSEDSELMAESVEISGDENFLEIGCGCGIVSIVLSKKSKNGVAVDINKRAVENTKKNAEANRVKNLEIFESDVFERVKGKFDVIVCNPPYTKNEARDNVDRMFWDPEDEMKRKFFKEAGKYLKQNGRIYFGWADFADIDVNLPFKLAEENGYTLKNIFSKKHKNDFTFYVLEFVGR